VLVCTADSCCVIFSYSLNVGNYDCATVKMLCSINTVHIVMHLALF